MPTLFFILAVFTSIFNLPSGKKSYVKAIGCPLQIHSSQIIWSKLQHASEYKMEKYKTHASVYIYDTLTHSRKV